MAIFKEFMHCVNKPFHSQMLHPFQFVGEMSNSHIYKFPQNNLYSYNRLLTRCITNSAGMMLNNEIEHYMQQWNYIKTGQTKSSLKITYIPII
jgi:hypothetical protein